MGAKPGFDVRDGDCSGERGQCCAERTGRIPLDDNKARLIAQ
jgi:hypothetical protein